MKYGGVAYETDLVYHEKIRDELLQNQVGGRIGFEGVEAELEVSDLYLGKRVPQPHWSTQNPVSYTYENDGRAKSYVHSAADSQKPRYAPAQIPASDASDDIDDLTEGMQKRIDSISDDIDDLAEGMQKLIDSIKEYE
jgi:hypothetical protein